MSKKKVVQLKWNEFIAYMEYEFALPCFCFRRAHFPHFGVLLSSSSVFAILHASRRD